MASLKYGMIETAGQSIFTQPLPLAASQVMKLRSGHFVYNNAGLVTVADSGTAVLGAVETGAYTSSSTAGAVVYSNLNNGNNS